MGPVSYDAVEEDFTSSLVIEIFDDLDKGGADVLLYGCPQNYMPNTVEGLTEVYEGMLEVLLVLEIFLTEDSKVDDMLRGVPAQTPASSTMIFSTCGFNLFRMIFGMILLGWLMRLIIW